MTADLPETCKHCALPIPAAERVVGSLKGKEHHFCCQGCLGAFLIINNAGLGEYYKRRQWQEGGTPEGSYQRTYTDQVLSRYSHPLEDGNQEISFLIEGIRCATCVWLLERIIGNEKGVAKVAINYSTHRARVEYDPKQKSPAALFEAVARLGYPPRPFTRDAVQKAAEKERKAMLIRFGTAAFLSMQLMGYSLALYAGYFQGMDQLARRLIQIFAALVTTPVVFYCGFPFLQGAWRSLKNRVANMDLLVSLGVLTAYFYSLYAMSVGREVFFDTSAMIVTLILMGRLFENMARNRAAAGIDQLIHLAPDLALKMENGSPTQVESNSLVKDDLVQVPPGERFPVDGVIEKGDTEVDESMLTGEPLPVHKGQGKPVTSGSLNILSSVTIRVKKTAADSFLARVARMVEEAQSRKAPIQRLADRLAAGFVPVVIIIALLTGSVWLLRGEGLTALISCVAVLVVACPCALGLATPTAVLAATGRAAKEGILFRGGDVLEATGRLSRAAFDKTGTLTQGHPKVLEIRPQEINELELLTAAARIEAGSSHPLAQGIMTAAHGQGVQVEVAGGTAIPGRGIVLEYENSTWRAGNHHFLTENGIRFTDPVSSTLTPVHIARDTTYLGCLLLEDPLRPKVREMLESLDKMGIPSTLLTGDQESTARHVAATTGMDFRAAMTPEDKTAWVRARIDEGEQVLMVGDGINDAPALSAASVACAMAGGTDVALETSDLVLNKPDFERLIFAIHLGRRTLAIIRQNLFWAFFYNLLAIPLAASGALAPIHAAAAMAASSVCVVLNSLRLNRVNFF